MWMLFEQDGLRAEIELTGVVGRNETPSDPSSVMRVIDDARLSSASARTNRSQRLREAFHQVTRLAIAIPIASIASIASSIERKAKQISFCH
jgi:hypothetical protein